MCRDDLFFLVDLVIFNLLEVFVIIGGDFVIIVVEMCEVVEVIY